MQEEWEDFLMGDTIEVQEHGTLLRFSFDEMLRYSGPGSPGGVALGLKLMQQAFPLLEPDGPLERREVVIETAFRGPGVRDACELVTRSQTDDRYVVDAELGRPERGDNLRTFAFRVGYRNQTVSLLLRVGFVTDEFTRLAQSSELSDEDQQRFTEMKQQLAERVLATEVADVFDVE
jgi:hypothetical protein